MIKRLSTILPVLVLALPVPAVQAQAPSQPPSQSKPQSQPPAQTKPPAQSKPQAPAQGGFLYKSTMPDGKVIYGDAPEKGAVKVDKTKPDTSKKGITTATPKEIAAAKKLDTERANPNAAPANRVADLEEALRKMEAAREKFKEPLEGERLGTAGGGGRFTDGYWDRQKKYDQGLQTMRNEVAKARAAGK